MTHVWKDRCLETSTTTGTGNFTLAGAVTGFRTLASVCSTNDTVYYFIEAVDSNGVPTGDWETGLGTYSASNTLTRTTVLDSSNSGSAVSFSAGTKWVGLCSPARAAQHQNGLGLGVMRPLSDFSQINISGNNSIAESSGKAITISTSTLTTTVNLVGIRRAIPSTPYRTAIFVQPNFAPLEFEALNFGFSDGTKYDTIALYCSGAEHDTWNTSTSRVSANGLTGSRGLMIGTGFWLSLEDDGTNAIWGISADGVNFGTIYQVAKSSGFLGSSGHTNLFVGYMPYLSGGTNYTMSLTIRTWDEAGLSRSF